MFLQIYGYDEEFKGDVIKYALIFAIEPRYFQDTCSNDVWVKAMEK